MNGDKLLEHYLSAACTGLFGLERQTVRDELEANLLERVREFQVMGCSREVALKKALEEFGAPSRVSRGMQEVYIMPKVMKGGVLLGVLAMGAYLAVGSSVAGPVEISLCDTNLIAKANPFPMCSTLFSFLRLSDLQADFTKQGYQLSSNRTTFKLVNQGKTLIDLKWANPNEVSKNVNGEEFINLNSLLTFDNDTQKVNVPVSFNTLMNPTINLGGAKLNPKKVGGTVDITIPVAWRVAFFLHERIDPKFEDFGYGNSITGTSFDASFVPKRQYTQTLERVGKPGKMYALAWIRKDWSIKRDPAKYLMNEFVETALATVTADRKLIFATHVPRFDFTNSLEEFKHARGKKAILLELTGRLDNAAPAFTVVKNAPRSSQSN